MTFLPVVASLKTIRGSWVILSKGKDIHGIALSRNYSLTITASLSTHCKRQWWKHIESEPTESQTQWMPMMIIQKWVLLSPFICLLSSLFHLTADCLPFFLLWVRPFGTGMKLLLLDLYSHSIPLFSHSQSSFTAKEYKINFFFKFWL